MRTWQNIAWLISNVIVMALFPQSAFPQLQTCLTWEDATAQVPSPRYAHAMAYDSLRNMTVLFGGATGSADLGDTWEWDGAQWWLRSTTGPGIRHGHAMAYDSLRGVVVLFGGHHYVNESQRWLGDTWEWDGKTWALRSSTGPSARKDHAMTFDDRRGVTVLFGGNNTGGVMRGTWEWDGSTWMFRTYGPPPSRAGHSIVYDKARGVTVMFGGYDHQTQLNDTWEWDGETWLPRSNSGPAGRSWFAMTYDSDRAVTVLHGGFLRFQDPCSAGTWEWDGTIWRLISTDEPRPTGRCDHAMVFDDASHASIVFGGALDTSLHAPTRDTWAWDGEQWSLRDAKPSGRHDSAMAFDPLRGVAVLFGGEGNGRYGDTWEWDGIVWQRRATTGPDPRAGHAMAYDTVRQVTLLFGRCCEDDPGDLWKWDGAAWSLIHAPGPDAGGAPAIAFDSTRGVLVFLREQLSDDYPVETWEFDGTSWALRSETGPPRRVYHTLAFDSKRGVTVLYGGTAGFTTYRDTWEWNGADWTLRDADGPAISGRMTFDSGRGVCVLCNESSAWEWDGQEWTHRADLPVTAYGVAVAYDAARRETVRFGGEPASYGDQTWLYAARTSDLDQDYIADQCDICPLTIPKVPVDDGGCPAVVAGDANRDGDVDLNDCATFILCFGAATTEACETADMDGDGIVGPLDVAGFLQKLDGPNVPVAP